MNVEKIKEWVIWRKKQNSGKKENKEKKLEYRDKTQKYLQEKSGKNMKESMNAKKKERKQID